MFRHVGRLGVTLAVLALAGGIPLAQAQTQSGLDAPQVDVQPAVESGAAALEATAAVSAERPVRTPKRTTQAQREAAAARAKAAREAAAAGRASSESGRSLMAERSAVSPKVIPVPMQGGVPDLFGTYSNWANSPRNMRKFVDTLPGLTAAGANNLGQYIPVAKPDKITYPGSDYYEISLVEWSEKMHSDLPVTRLRGYVQTNNGTDPGGANTLTPDPAHYLGPAIVAQKNRPVRIKFTNALPTGAAGRLFVPVDVSVMGAGPGPDIWTGVENPVPLCERPPGVATPAGCFTENRATLHLHGGKTPWISDGTPRG